MQPLIVLASGGPGPEVHLVGQLLLLWLVLTRLLCLLTDNVATIRVTVVQHPDSMMAVQYRLHAVSHQCKALAVPCIASRTPHD